MKPSGLNKLTVNTRSSIDSPPKYTLPVLVSDAESTGEIDVTRDSRQGDVYLIGGRSIVRSSLDYEQNLSRANSI